MPSVCLEVGQTTYEDNSGNVTTAVDVMIVMDGSSSMDTEHAWLPGMVERLEAELRSNGIGTSSELPNLYALVEFGQSRERAQAHTLTARGRPFFAIDEFYMATEQLFSDVEGNREDGYQAIIHAFDTLPYRRSPAVALNVILVTDEDRDVLAGAEDITRDVVKARILQEGAVLNVVVDNMFQALNGTRALGVDSFGTAYLAQGALSIPTKVDIELGAGYGRTRRSYTELALETGGAAWDINLLRGGGDLVEPAFTSSFVRVKTAEVKQRVAVCQVCLCTSELQWACRPDPDQEMCKCRAEGDEVCCLSSVHTTR